MIAGRHHADQLSLGEKIAGINWVFVFVVLMIGAVGCAMLYSAANGEIWPWAGRHAMLMGLGLVVIVGVVLIDIRLWMRYAYWIYAVGLLGLVAVELIGASYGGAQRWIPLGPINVQPSEFMKVAVVLALARYFHGPDYEDVGKIWRLIVPAGLVLLPVAMIMRQPDLGTAGFIVLVGAVMFFLAGVRLWKFAVVGVLSAAAVPVVWGSLKPYQQNRVLTFLNPENDPSNTGYHILQSKIALGSGGVFGKGFLAQGSQSHLNFLPAKHTDFIFTMLAEEFGLLGGLGLMGLYLILLGYGFSHALRARSQFARLLGLGIVTILFLHIFINIAMVMGLFPVVGLPLPLMSYGGSFMGVLMFAFGLLMCLYVYRDTDMGRRGAADEKVPIPWELFVPNGRHGGSR